MSPPCHSSHLVLVPPVRLGKHNSAPPHSCRGGWACMSAGTSVRSRVPLPARQAQVIHTPHCPVVKRPVLLWHRPCRAHRRSFAGAQTLGQRAGLQSPPRPPARCQPCSEVTEFLAARAYLGEGHARRECTRSCALTPSGRCSWATPQSEMCLQQPRKAGALRCGSCLQIITRNSFHCGRHCRVRAYLLVLTGIHLQRADVIVGVSFQHIIDAYSDFGDGALVSVSCREFLHAAVTGMRWLSICLLDCLQHAG